MMQAEPLRIPIPATETRGTQTQEEVHQGHESDAKVKILITFTPAMAQAGVLVASALNSPSLTKAAVMRPHCQSLDWLRLLSSRLQPPPWLAVRDDFADRCLS